MQLPTGRAFIIVAANRQYNTLTQTVNTQLKAELERFLSIIHTMHINRMQNQNKTFLLEVSTKLLKSHDKKIILEEIIASLTKRYPNYTYCLNLTQEYDTAQHLPIKIMEYNKNESLDQTSIQVFMNAELQIERLTNEGKKAVYAPLIGEQSVYGVLEIKTPIDCYFSTQELDFIGEFAVLAGKALEKSILYEDSLMQVNNLTLLNDIIHELNSSAELSEITKLIKDKIYSLTAASQIGFIYFNEEEKHGFNVLSGSSDFFRENPGYKLIEKINIKLNKNPEPIFSGDDSEITGYGFHSVMAIPMIYSGLRMGFVVVLHENKYQFTFERFKLIESLIHHSSLAISNTILKEKLQETVITDFLTRLHSRRYLEESISQHIANGNTGVLLLFDIDNFKQVNDQYGHHVGDVVLKQVAHIIDIEVGNAGIAARWGGEELAVYLPEVTLVEGSSIANKIRTTVAAVTEPAVTVSCGLSSWENGSHDTEETLFLRADEALYKAKSSGKNCVLSFR
ncbi:diguanylate cyclase [Ralstonia pickettii]|nr:diguanylate cyclase [Ralstonia pickettii]